MMEFIPHLGTPELVNKTASIIEINGHRYDAVSGQLMGVAKQAVKRITKPIDGLSIDGFTRRPTKLAKQSAVQRSVHNLQRKPEKSRTLMRSIVRRPARQTTASKIKARRFKPDFARAARAAQIRQDAKVKRFGILSFSKSRNSSPAKSGEVLPKGMRLSTSAAGPVAATLPATGSASHQKLERLLDYALASADAHKKALEAKKYSSRRFWGRLPRWGKVLLVILVVVALAGVILWQKLPAATMRLAASRAHIHASLPLALPGYKIGPITASEHAVTTTIQSLSNSSKKYTVTEAASSQPTSSLAATAPSGNVQKIQDQDKTYLLSQDGSGNTAECTKGDNTVSVTGTGLNAAELLDAAKNACKE